MARVAVIAQTAGLASRTERQRLSLSATEAVLRLARLRYQGERPLAYENVVLPLARFPGLADAGEITCGIGEIAHTYGLALGLATEHANLVRAGRAAAAHLGIAEGAQVMRLDRVVATLEGHAVEWRVAFTIADP